MISPTEQKGVALGIRQVRQDSVRSTFSGAHGLVGMKVHCVFEVAHGKQRHELRTYAKSRAGAWRIAVRWFRGLKKGKL